MKLPALPRPSRRVGSVLVVTLLISMVIGITLAAFMDLSGAQHRSVIRSGVWNSCIPVAESGLEEALTHVFLNSTNLATQGWTQSNSGLTMSNGIALTGTVYYKSRQLNGGSFLVAIQSGTTPTITVQGNMPKPLSTTDMISRTIEVRTVGGALFARGMVARGNIDWNGNILSDSFDSQDPAFSTNGLYVAARRKDNGSVGSVNGNITMGGGTIYGSASTGPTGSITPGSGGKVGDATFIEGGGTGIQAGHSANDLNVAFPDAKVPFTSDNPPREGSVTNSTVITNATAATALVYPTTYVGTVSSNRPTASTYPTGTTYPVSTNVTATAGNGNSGNGNSGNGNSGNTTYTTNFTYTQFAFNTNSLSTNTTTTYYKIILDSGDYRLDSISLTGDEQMLVLGNARLWVDSSIAMRGSSQITIANTGTLQVWVGGTVDIGGNGVVNSTSDATHLALYGLPTCTSISLGGNAAWTGTIYAPQADFKSGGGGTDNYDVVGAVIVNTVFMNGRFQFHYDENLGRNGPSGSFVISSWVEL